MSDVEALMLLYDYIELLEERVTRQQLLDLAEEHPEVVALLPELALH